MQTAFDPKLAKEFVDLLVPEHFAAAEGWLRPHSEYFYQGGVLRGLPLLNAFKESHAKASQELHAIEYLPGSISSVSEDAIIVGVSDRLFLNEKMHLYSDRLSVSLKQDEAGWYVARLEHLPIQQERDNLKNFLQMAGPKQL